MRSKSVPQSSTEVYVRENHRQPRERCGSEQKIGIVLEGLRGEYSIAEICRREGIAQSLHYKWSKEFLEAAKSGCRVTLSARPHPVKLQTCAARWATSRRRSQAFRWKTDSSKQHDRGWGR